METKGIWEWIVKFIPHFVMDVITYPCSEYSLSKGNPACNLQQLEIVQK